MQIDDGMKPLSKKLQGRRRLSIGDEDFGEVGISIKAGSEPRLDKHRDSKAGEFFLQGPYRSGQQQAVPHRAQTYQKDTGGRREPLKKVFSLQLSLR